MMAACRFSSLMLSILRVKQVLSHNSVLFGLIANVYLAAAPGVPGSANWLIGLLQPALHLSAPFGGAALERQWLNRTTVANGVVVPRAWARSNTSFDFCLFAGE